MTSDVDTPLDTRDAEPVARAAPAGRMEASRRAEAAVADLSPDPDKQPGKRKKKRGGVLSAMSGFLTFLLAAFFVGGFALVGAHHKLREPGPLAADKVVFITPGTDVPDIIALLEREGVVDNTLLLNAALVVEGARSKLKAGEYLIKQRASLQDVMDTLVSGRQILHAVTVPEGLTSEQIIQRLRDLDVLTGDVREAPKEGTLLPETFKVARGMARNDLIRKMQDDQRKLVDQIWARRSPDLPVKTPYEMVTLASIVEKETGKADERPRVAGVFINRLNKRMRLQSDPTIVYGLVAGRGTLGRGILRSEVTKWTPYNTYTIDGLPPGPIANPGRAALEAVANPSRTADLYFVADGTGGHVFAETLDQHARNVARWRQIEKEAKEKGLADVDKAPEPDPPNAAAPAGAPAPAAPRPNRRGDLDPSGFGRLAALASGSSFDAYRVAALAPTPPPAGRVTATPYGGDPTSRTIAAIVAEQSRSPPPKAQDGASAMMAALNPPPSNKEAELAQALSFGPDVETLGMQVRGVQGRSSLLDGPISASEAEPAFDDESLGATPGATVRRIHAFDASEGTALDPLRNKAWDLNHAQAIPTAAPR